MKNLKTNLKFLEQCVSPSYTRLKNVPIQHITSPNPTIICVVGSSLTTRVIHSKVRKRGKEEGGNLGGHRY